MRLWLLTRRITHLLEKGDKIRGEALHLAPQSCGFRLLRFTLQLPTPNVPHMHFLAQPVQASIPSDLFHSRNWGHPKAAGPSFTWRGLFIRRFCEFGFGFWRDAALYEPWRPSFTSRHCDPLLWPFQLFLFCRFFALLLHFCFWTFFVSDLWFFLICIFVLSPLLLFDSFSSYVMNFFLLGLFFFMSFSCFPVVYLLVFPSWNHFSFFPQKSVSFMLVLSLPFSFCFDLSTKYLVSFAQFFLLPFFLFSLFSYVFLS